MTAGVCCSVSESCVSSSCQYSLSYSSSFVAMRIYLRLVVHHVFARSPVPRSKPHVKSFGTLATGTHDVIDICLRSGGHFRHPDICHISISYC